MNSRQKPLLNNSDWVGELIITKALCYKQTSCRTCSHFQVLVGLVSDAIEEKSNFQSQLLVFATDSAFF